MAEKTISELAPITQLSDSALFVAEQNGASGSVTAAQLRGGMPDPSEMEDGTAMVAYDGAWHQQDGYGYSVPAKVTWDGDPTGKETVEAGGGMVYVKVSDAAPSYEILSDELSIAISSGGEETVYTFGKSEIVVEPKVYGVAEYVLVVLEDYYTFTAGTWFVMEPGEAFVSRFDYGDSGKKIDGKLLPTEMWTFTLENGTVVTKKVVVGE